MDSFESLLWDLNKGNMQEALDKISTNLNLRDTNDSTFLHRIINVRAAVELIKMGMDINVKNNRGSTPIHSSVKVDKDDLCQEFLKVFCVAGAIMTSFDFFKNTPLVDAIERDKLKSAKVLISNGCRILRDLHIKTRVDVILELIQFENGVVACRDVIVILLGLKKKRTVLPKIDRFLIKEVLAVEIWTTREEKTWQH